MASFLDDFDAYQHWLSADCQRLQLPPVDALAAEFSYRLSQQLAQNIEQQGAIAFSHFMQQALYQPGLGYYSAGSHKLGEGGDFVTAPELSPLFAQTLAASFIRVFEQSAPQVLELGAGSAAFAIELLTTLQQQNALPERYCILEVSAELKQRQQTAIEQALPQLMSRVEWLERLPPSFDGLIFANEVADALPVELVRKQQAQLQLAQVELTPTGFDWRWQPLAEDAEINPYCEQWADGYCSELHRQSGVWMAELVACLRQGAVMLIDYGYSAADYYSPHRSQGTLQCYYRQRKHHEPLRLPGLQDITASVNFSQLASSAHQQGAEIIGYTEQALFLMASGIEKQATALAQRLGSDTMAQLKVSHQLKKLLMPDEMGENCKVLVAAKQCSLQLDGFTLGNQLHRL